MKKISLTRILLLLLTLCSSSIMAKSASVLLREGLYAEEVEGDLNTAIKVYQQVINDKNAQDNLVAQALYRQGMCHMKLKNELAAKSAFDKLLANHSDQISLIEKVKPLLEELGNADPASLMPPETIMYVEIGSPGKQIETILNVLKGTPFENPLAMIGNNMGGPSTGQPNPANMVGALLNPSMMAEFKKIRGMGVGITGIAEGTPPAVVVLYPGQSDALRGLLVAALGMAGRPIEPIEGMKVVTLPEGGAAAYDDNVVIMTSPTAQAIEQLRWSAKQYKGLMNQPSLASSNQSFARISKRARQDNALTLWLNVNETYQGLMRVLPPDEIPQQIHMANGLVDFKNVEDIIASFSLAETGLALEANLNLKEGHNCMAYNMIRTPNLSRAALKAVPPEAVALFSLTLGRPGTPQADAVGQQIANATGMDIGADLFANIDQITLFAVPAEARAEYSEGQIPPQVKGIGLAITSADPQKTRGFLTNLLRSTEMLTAETEPVNGKFDLTLANNLKVFGFTDQVNKTTLLSLNPDLLASSIAATKKGPAGASTLQSALRHLPDNTSKLVMLSVAGIIRAGAQQTHISDEQLADQIKNALAQLAQATEKTTVRFQTIEEANSLGIRLSIADLPPANRLFGPIMQIRQAWAQVEAQAQQWQGAPQTHPADIAATEKTPKIDGQVDICWADARSYDLKNSYYGAPSSDADLSASFKTLFDEHYLYVLVDVSDEEFRNDSQEQWLDDGVEIFIDADYSRGREYDDNDHQYFFSYDPTSPVMGEAHQGKTGGVQYAFAKNALGYRLEVKFPWAVLGTDPLPGTPIGFDVQVNDDDDGGERDSKIAWHAPQDDAWNNPKAFGTAQPLGLVGWWKLDESGNGLAPDASGNGRQGRLLGSPVWKPAAGRVGGALAFDGQDDAIQIENETHFDASGGVTVAAWVKVTALDKPWQAIDTKGDYAWRIQRNSEESTLEFACTGLDIPGGNQYGSLYSSKTLTPGRWYHVAGTYDGSKMSLYVDGALDVSQDASGAINTTDAPVMIGANAEMPDRHWNGMIDDVRVYNHAVDAAEIAAWAGR